MSGIGYVSAPTDFASSVILGTVRSRYDVASESCKAAHGVHSHLPILRCTLGTYVSSSHLGQF